jgi:hypothetical protein
MNQARTIPSHAAQARSTGVLALVAGIESSSILLPAPATLAQGGSHFDDVDIEILEWIAAHGRGKRRSRWVM